MWIPKELKLNKFKKVAIPSKGEYMARFGAINTPQNMSGDEKVIGAQRTTDTMRDYDNFEKDCMVKHTQQTNES